MLGVWKQISLFVLLLWSDISIGGVCRSNPKDQRSAPTHPYPHPRPRPPRRNDILSVFEHPAEWVFQRASKKNACMT